ncbi:MAG: uracil-DNA glycosylase [Chloroflexota bacterium]
MTDTLEVIAAQVNQCKACSLYFGRKNAVPGVGPTDADIMFIGEGPGFHEDQQGLPFVGPAGRFLDELLESIGLTRGNVFIANVVKCRPPGNRDPKEEELNACRNFLDRQIAVIQPKMIVTLGRFSMARYFPNAKISSIHGRPSKVEGVLIFPMYHPAAALHRPSLRSTVEEDMAKIPDILARIDEYADSKPQDEAKQLSFF